MSGSTAKPTTASTASTTSCGGGTCLPVCSLEKAMDIIVKTFHEYAPRQDYDDYLSPKDMREMLECQAPTFLSACGRGNPKYLDELFKKADVNHDKKLSFEEAIYIFSILAIDAHHISHGEDRCHPDKH